MTHLCVQDGSVALIRFNYPVDHDHIVASPSALALSVVYRKWPWVSGAPGNCIKLCIFPNILKTKRLSSSHSVHFAVGVTRLKDVSGTF